MQASFITHNDGTLELRLDKEAARASFASVIFAAKFHTKFAQLAEAAEQCQRGEEGPVSGRQDLCR